MKTIGIDHLVLTVKNIETTVVFYTQVLGMQKEVFGEGRVALKFGDQKFNLHESGSEFQPNAKNPVPGSVDICLLTESSVEHSIQHLEQQEIEIIEGPVVRTGAQGVIKSLYIRDPDENLIEISTYVE